MDNIRLIIIYSLLCSTCFFLISTSCLAEHHESLDDIVSEFEEDEEHDNSLDKITDGFEENGFEDDSAEKSVFHDNTILPFLIIDGFLKMGSSYNFAHDEPDNFETDWQGLSRLRSEFQLEFGFKPYKKFKAFISSKASYDFIYTIKERDQFTPEVLDTYEKELELRETYIQGSVFKNLDLKIGRQILVWGKSDSIRVTDVLNPVDLREPGLTDIEDLRLPVAMTRLDYYMGSLSITGIAIHEIRFNKSPCYGSDYYYIPGVIPEEVPSSSNENTEFAFAANGIFKGWDISLYLADIYDDKPYMEMPPMLLKHARLKMVGAAFNAAMENFLVKTEATFLDGFKISTPSDTTFSRIDILFGIEYSGLKNSTISVETVLRHINRFDVIPDNDANENEFQSVIRITKHFMNETLKSSFLASTFGITGEDGAFQRISAEYDITDALTITSGIVLYQSGDLPELSNIGDNDRFFFDVKYNF